MIVDVWMQHPTKRHSEHEMFASLRRWTKSTARPGGMTHEMTIAAMDSGGVSLGHELTVAGDVLVAFPHESLSRHGAANPRLLTLPPVEDGVEDAFPVVLQ